MATEYKAMKVVVRLNGDGGALYPEFGTLPIVQASGLRVAKYIDRNSVTGVEYDKTSGHSDDDAHSPLGTQLVIIIGLSAFVDAAVAAFADCTYMAPATAATQWALRITPFEDEEILNAKVLATLADKVALGGTLTALQLEAIDPLTDVPGITKNHHKVLTDLIAKKGVTLA
jgi:hypothetical protein